MMNKHVPGAPLEIAMGGRSLLTPLTGIQRYAYNLAQEFVQVGHNVSLFCGTHWSSQSSEGRERAERLSWRRAAEETLNVYRQVVA
jgi:hypothetical protein